MQLPTPQIQHPLPEIDLIYLRERFLYLSDNNTIHWEELARRYSEKERAYHNLSHILSMLRVLDTLSIEDPKHIMEWAIWYHDIIYNSRRKDNELKSAELFRQHQSHLPPDDQQSIYDIIISTQKHEPINNSSFTKYVLDIDLFILAAPIGIYTQYTAAIRQEYAWVPSVLYRRGRKKVLRHFLDRKHIYFTDFFNKNYDTLARENMSNE